MPNPNKIKGDRFEAILRDYFRTAGFFRAAKTKAGYERDAGDIHLDPLVGIGPGVICQAKNVATPRWSEWLAGLEKQITEARAEYGFIAWKRRGIAKPEQQLAVMPMDQFVRLLRDAGFGQPLEEYGA